LTPADWRAAQQIEDGARAKLDASRPDVLHRRMMRGREHESDAGLADAASHGVGRKLDLDAECGEHVGGARARRQGAVAVLCHRTPAPATMKAAQVEML